MTRVNGARATEDGRKPTAGRRARPGPKNDRQRRCRSCVGPVDRAAEGTPHLTRDGKLNQDSRRKLKQVYHLYNFIEPLLEEVLAAQGG